MKVVCVKSYKDADIFEYKENYIYEVLGFSSDGKFCQLKEELNLPGSKGNSLLIDTLLFNEHFITLAQFRENRINDILK